MRFLRYLSANVAKAARSRAATMQPTIMPTRAPVLESPEVLDTGTAVTLDVGETLIEEGLFRVDGEEVVEATMVGIVLASTATPRANPSYG